ncbi:MAG TPA: hypothetical protein VJV79_33350 [Polyangiaceae bacterium]|nr:hypothetical protein [Polyangiaceae bacterium]
MFRSLISKSIFVTSLAALLPSLAACSAEPSNTHEQAASGTISLPLIASANGHQYRLSNAYVYITGPQYAQLTSSDDPNETALSTTLQTGNYTAHLYNWSLELEDGSGTFRPVQATLASSSAVEFGIYNGTTSTVSYQFATDGVIVTVGAGALKVAIAVDEGTATCRPFSDDCGSGAWCPPTGLTGAPRACIAAGSTPIGEPCAAPSECVANASCFDLGSGPLCIELCGVPGGELSCASGGTCTPVGLDYGQCTPLAPEQP